VFDFHLRISYTILSNIIHFVNFVNGSQWAMVAKCPPKITMFEMILGMDLGLLQWVA